MRSGRVMAAGLGRFIEGVGVGEARGGAASGYDASFVDVRWRYREIEAGRRLMAAEHAEMLRESRYMAAGGHGNGMLRRHIQGRRRYDDAIERQQYSGREKAETNGRCLRQRIR